MRGVTFIALALALVAVATAVTPAQERARVERDLAKLRQDLDVADGDHAADEAALQVGDGATSSSDVCINPDRVKTAIYARDTPWSNSKAVMTIPRDAIMTRRGSVLNKYLAVTYRGQAVWVAIELVQKCDQKKETSWFGKLKSVTTKVGNWWHETHDDNVDKNQHVSTPKSWWNRATNAVGDMYNKASNHVKNYYHQATGASEEENNAIKQRYGSVLRKITYDDEDGETPMSDLDPSNPCHAYHGVKEAVGNGGRNQAGDVAMVKKRLRQLGFDVGSSNSEFIRAIKLFQTIVKSETKISGDGNITPGGMTDKWLKAANAPGWMKFADFDGYYNYDIPQERGRFSYGTTWVNDFFAWAAPQAKRIANVHRVVSNDVSLEHGGWNRDHSTHESGLSIDMPLPKYPRDKTDNGDYRKEVGWSAYNREGTRQLLRVFKAYPNFRRAFLNDRTLINEGLCGWSKGHHNHIHVDIKAPTRVVCGKRVKAVPQPGGGASAPATIPPPAVPTQAPAVSDATRVNLPRTNIPVPRPRPVDLGRGAANSAPTSDNWVMPQGASCNHGQGRCASPLLCKYGYWPGQCGRGPNYCCKPRQSTLPAGRPCNNNQGACAYRQHCRKGYWGGHCGSGSTYCCKP